MVGQPDGAQDAQGFLGLCVPDDSFLVDIIQTSCRLFHAEHCWPGYPRTLDEDVARASQLTHRVAPQTGKVRWFFFPCSDPARIAWEGTFEAVIAGALANSDAAGIAERGLLGRVEFLLVFFGGYLTHAGDFLLAETFFEGLIARGLEAEGYLGLADIRHTLANWREELREFEDRNVCPRGVLVPASCAADPISKLKVFDFDQAIALYEEAARAAPEGVSFYRLHLARARIDAGDLQGGRAELQTAAAAPNPNPFVGIYLNSVDRLIERPENSTGDFLPGRELRERYHSLTAARLVDVDSVAAIAGEEPVVLCEPTRLQGQYVAVVDGQAIIMPLDLDYPATKGLHLAFARDLGIGNKLAFDQLVIAEGPRVGLRRLKMFAKPMLMTGDDHVLVGLPRQNEVIRSDRPLAPLPGASFNYYHWLIDSMGAAALLDRKLGPGAVDFVVNRILSDWQQEILGMVAPGARVHTLPGPTEYRVLIDAFHLPPPARLHVPHPEAIRILRARMSRHRAPRKGKRVWVGRTGTRGRMAVNEAAVQDYLARQGFEVFDPTGKTVAEQIAYFSDVEVLVALGGAALTNLLFCPDETKAVILSTAFHYHETWTALASAIGQRCWVCIAGSETRPNPYMIWAVFDQDVRLEDVAVAVEQAVSA